MKKFLNLFLIFSCLLCFTNYTFANENADKAKKDDVNKTKVKKEDVNEKFDNIEIIKVKRIIEALTKSASK